MDVCTKKLGLKFCSFEAKVFLLCRKKYTKFITSYDVGASFSHLQKRGLCNLGVNYKFILK